MAIVLYGKSFFTSLWTGSREKEEAREKISTRILP
jgi:hypothetical protein